MDPLTHMLTGACIGRAGFNRKTAYATVACLLAAEAADLDVLWGLGGPVEELKFHRGPLHALVAVPAMAALVLGAVWLYHRLRPPKKRGQRVHWLWLYGAVFVAALSHPLFDWTNNYGIRLFLPFNRNWFAGSFMFIVEPEILAVLVLALAVPWLLGLTDREIGARRVPFRGRLWAAFALLAIVALCTWRWTERDEGLAMLANTQVASEPVLRMTLEPYPLNPYRWHAILETKDFYQTAEVSTWDPDSLASIASDAHTDVIYKPAVTPAVEAARRTFLGQVYLHWSAPWALVRDVGPQAEPGLAAPVLPPGRHWTTVTFNNLRFDYPILATQTVARNPLSGWVYIVDGNEEAGEGMDGRAQK